MKIAIVGPSPVPFGVGGMEYLLWGLQDHINDLTNHKVELIKLPSKENTFWDLIQSYKNFYNLDLSHFDMVITTKYPAWMVKHPNHICYMAHRLRGLYDTYHFMNLPQEPSRNNILVNEVLDYLETPNATVEQVFILLEQLKEKEHTIPKEHLEFPSAFLRKIIHFLDNKGLENTEKFYAISKTVKSRKEYFPANANVEVVYPPSFLPYFNDTKDGDYIFTISRLDGAKRINLIIEAMKQVKGNIKLKIAGTGPDEEKLKELAAGDSRIEFLGFVNDEEAIKYYGESKGVIYIPYEEDYGLVTIEAMMSKKPVITCYDSGGTTEFVQEGITGFISQSQVDKITSSIEKLDSLSGEKLKQMGENCYQTVKNITWGNVVKYLTDNEIIITEPKSLKYFEHNRKKITLTSTFEIYPPKGGGQARTFNLLKNLACEYDIDIVSFTQNENTYFKGLISKGLTEIRVPKSDRHTSEEWELEKKCGMPITDIGMMELSALTSRYTEELRISIESSDIVIVSHPFLLKEVKKYIGDKPFIYDAQDVEYNIKKESLPSSKVKNKLLNQLFELEKECCEESKYIMTCSEEDKKQLVKLYRVSEEKVIVVPNGVDIDETKFTDIITRKCNKRRLGLEKEKLGVFMGSWHPPNLEACEHIFKIADRCNDTKFLLMGSQCLAFKDRKLPGNVGLLGIVSDEVKNKVFSAVDFALNPMLSGSGTNLKMFDYMAAGIPIITTEFGTRGIERKDCFLMSDIKNMHEYINHFKYEQYKDLIEISRKYVMEEFSWKTIVDRLNMNIDI